MSGLQAEVMASILQGKAPTRRNDACAESHIIAVDEGASVSFAVHHTQVDRVGGRDRRATREIRCSALGVDLAAAKKAGIAELKKAGTKKSAHAATDDEELEEAGEAES